MLNHKQQPTSKQNISHQQTPKTNHQAQNLSAGNAIQSKYTNNIKHKPFTQNKHKRKQYNLNQTIQPIRTLTQIKKCHCLSQHYYITTNKSNNQPHKQATNYQHPTTEKPNKKTTSQLANNRQHNNHNCNHRHVTEPNKLNPKQ